VFRDEYRELLIVFKKSII